MARLLALLLLQVAAGSCINNSCVSVRAPSVVLNGVSFSTTVTLLPFLSEGEVTIPHLVDIVVAGVAEMNDSNTDQFINVSTIFGNGTAHLTHTLGPLVLSSNGYQNITLEVIDADTHNVLCPSTQMEVLVIPGWLTILPAIITTIVAIVFRQVMIAMFVGILVGAFFAEGYNPVTAFTTALDKYFVNAYADVDHAQVMVILILLGGMVGLIQKSGGTIAMVKLIRRVASTPRRVCLMAILICLFLFNDDYSVILITGYSMSKIMDHAGVSKEKFAFIIQCMAPCLASSPPIMGWVAPQMGYLLSGFSDDSCTGSVNTYTLVLQTLPYRFLPILMIVCVVLVCVLSRDFGPMLTAEREARRLKAVQIASGGLGHEENSAEEERREGDEQQGSENVLSGPLSPKQGVPHRWYNAVVPLFAVVVSTFVGLIVDGYLYIAHWNEDHYDEQRINVSVMTIFSNGDAISSLIWGTSLATVLLLLMLLGQRILSFTESITTWTEGVKDLTEPMIVLNLSWALGAVIQNLQTSNFIAQAVRGSLPPQYIPGITAIIGYFISFSIGSAYGTMGILFPLIIPVVCQLTPDEDNTSSLRIQTAAAILSSCIFGNLISPLADLTILTRVSTQCDINSHLRTASLYVLLVGFLAVLFGALPVGAGWYPWYVGWILMLAALIAVFILFSSGHTATSRSLCRIGCPCLFTLVTKLLHSLSGVRESLTQCFKGKQKETLQIQVLLKASDDRLIQNNGRGDA